MKDVIDNIRALQTRYASDDWQFMSWTRKIELTVRGRVGHEVLYAFGGYAITLEVYMQVAEWMMSGIPWDDFIAQKQTFTPTSTVVESDVVIIEPHQLQAGVHCSE